MTGFLEVCMKNETYATASTMNAPLFNHTMVFKLLAIFTLIGAVAAVVPIPRFETENKSVGFEAPMQKAVSVRVAVLEQGL